MDSERAAVPPYAYIFDSESDEEDLAAHSHNVSTFHPNENPFLIDMVVGAHNFVTRSPSEMGNYSG